MGSAMVNAWLGKKVCKTFDLLVFDRNPKKLEFLKSKLEDRNSKLKTSVGDFSKLSKYDVVVLAVKPQDILKILKKIKTHLSKKAIVISIAAGISIKRIASELGKVKIVRAMPNMPVQINMGIVGWTTNAKIATNDIGVIKKLLGTIGYEIYFSDEKKLDVVTAVSGSGPAYVFYFMEALFEAGYKLGLSNEEATSLAMGTFIGSSLMVNLSGKSPKELRKQVASKRGTTEAAIKVFDKNKVKRIVFDAVQSAYKRTKELNQ